MDGRRKRLKPLAHFVPGRAVIKSENINKDINNLPTGGLETENCSKLEAHIEPASENGAECEANAFTLFDIKHPIISNCPEDQTAVSSTIETSKVKLEHVQACTFMPAQVTDDVDLETVTFNRLDQNSEVTNVCHHEEAKCLPLEYDEKAETDWRSVWGSTLTSEVRKSKQVHVGKHTYLRQPKRKEGKTRGKMSSLHEQSKQKNDKLDQTTDSTYVNGSPRNLTDTSTGTQYDDKNHRSTHSVVNYGGRTRRKFFAMWSSDENEEFYAALRTYGTDFSLMETAFGGRKTRRELKAKFNKEDKRNPEFISKCLFPQAEQYSSHRTV